MPPNILLPTISLYHNITIFQYKNTTILRYYCIVILQQPNIVIVGSVAKFHLGAHLV